jgi:hypothetical protein
VPNSTHRDDVSVEAAINDVLVSRRRAVDAMARAEQDGARIVDGSRDAARRIAERAERRIRAMRAAFEAAGRAKLAAIDAEVERHGAAHELMPADDMQLARAVEALCNELTGTRDEPSR